MGKSTRLELWSMWVPTLSQIAQCFSIIHCSPLDLCISLFLSHCMLVIRQKFTSCFHGSRLEFSVMYTNLFSLKCRLVAIAML